MTVKNYDGSEILLYLQATKLACQSVMDTSRRHKTPDSDTKDILLFSAIVVGNISTPFPKAWHKERKMICINVLSCIT